MANHSKWKLTQEHPCQWCHKQCIKKEEIGENHSSAENRWGGGGGGALRVLGEINVNVHQGGNEALLPLLVVRGSGPTLLGRNWLAQFCLDWKEVHRLQQMALSELLDEICRNICARSSNPGRSGGQNCKGSPSTVEVSQSSFHPACHEQANRQAAGVSHPRRHY